MLNLFAHGLVMLQAAASSRLQISRRLLHTNCRRSERYCIAVTICTWLLHLTHILLPAGPTYWACMHAFFYP